ncbi:MAG: hypothetical protein ABJA78_16055 [Ferruginibacter sp.]
MSDKNKKQFGIWMNEHHATVVGREPAETGAFAVLGHASNENADTKPSEKSGNNAEKMHLHKFFKQIDSLIVNAEEIHVTGTGTAQEQFIHYLHATPQFKNTIAKESTSNKMGDDKLIAYITEQFN